MQHKWTDDDGIKNNFCIKCGIKKSSARRRSCVFTKKNWKKNLDHDFKERYKNHLGKIELICKNCGVEANKRWSAYATATKDETREIYVPYVEKTDKDGNFVRRQYTTNSKYQRTKQEKAGRVIKFWHIKCAYTDDELEVRDIII